MGTITGWGAYFGSRTVADVVDLAGRPLDHVHRFAGLAEQVPTADLDAIDSAGSRPLLSLEPWEHEHGADDERYSLPALLRGEHDTAFRRWAHDLAAWDNPLYLRFAHEMNGDWYPWGVGVHGNQPSMFREAWVRVCEIFRAAGADKVAFVWAPNVAVDGVTGFTDFYPGSSHVDVLGLDGYNWGDQRRSEPHRGGPTRWTGPHEIFDASLAALAALPGTAPIWLTEIGCADDPDPARKATWIGDVFDMAAATDRVEAITWFDVDKERDWRFASTSQSTDAFRKALLRVVRPSA